MFPKKFQNKDPLCLNKILIIAKNEEVKILKEEVEKLLSIKKEHYCLEALPENVFFTTDSSNCQESLLQNIDLCLIFSQNSKTILSSLLFSFGIPFFSLEGFLEVDRPEKEHKFSSTKELLDDFKKLLLNEPQKLSQLSNLSRNFFIKERRKEKHLEKKEKVSFFHVINPVPENIRNDLYIASPLVFSSFEKAKNYVSNTIFVTQAFTAYEEEENKAPNSFLRLSPLTRSVLDLKNFKEKRKLPILSDILKKAYQESKDSDYIIYTNADIILLPHFYARIEELIQEGYDGIVVNRRTISKKWALEEEIHGIYSEFGESHPGFDCFIFKKEAYQKFELGEDCLGVHLAGTSLFYNLLAISKKFVVLKEDHLTCHIGDDNASKNIQQLDYIKHNTTEVLTVLEKLEKKFNLYTRIKTEKLEKKHGSNILKFNFAPGKFVTREFQGNKIVQKNALEKPIMVHSRDHLTADFFLKKLSEGKNHLRIKGRLKQYLGTLSQLTRQQEELEKTIYQLTQSSLHSFFESTSDKQIKIELLQTHLCALLKDYTSKNLELSSPEQFYTVDCKGENLFNLKNFQTFSEKIKQLTQKEGTKTLVHLIYEDNYLHNIKEAFPQYFHITFFEHKASDLVIHPKKLEEDSFYQMRVAFELLCLNKTVSFEENRTTRS